MTPRASKASVILGPMMFVALSACDSRRFVEWPSQPFVAAFVLRAPQNEVLSGDGALDLRPPNAPRVDVDLEPEQSLELIGVEGSEPIFEEAFEADLSVPASVRLVRDTSECASNRLVADRKVRLDLEPFTTLVWSESRSWQSSSPPADLELEAPLVDRPCTGGTGPLEAFGATALLLDDGAVVGGIPRFRGVDGDYVHFDDVVRFDDECGLVSSNYFLFLLRRGQPYSDDPRTTMSFGDGKVKISRVVGLDVNRALVLVAPDLDDEGVGHIHEVDVSSGQIVVVRTATISELVAADLHVSQNGDIILSGGAATGGIVAVGPSIFGPFELFLVPEAIVDLEVGSDPDIPITAMSRASVYRGKLGALERSNFEALGTRGAPTRLNAVAVSASTSWVVGAAVDVDATTTPLPLITIDEKGAELSPLPIPDVAASCGPYELCGRHYSFRLVAVTPFPSAPHKLALLMGNCAVVLIYDTVRRCSTALTHPFGAQIDELQQLSITDRWLTAVGKHGSVLEARLD